MEAARLNVTGFDELIARLAGNGALGLVVAVLLGLRHATDPDHLTAVSTLVLSDDREGARRAGTLGLAWGMGHAATLFAFGLPVVLFRRYLPEAVQRGAEVIIGLVIAGLAVRLLVRWRRGYFHAHPHLHGEVRHTHPHVHEERRTAHPHREHAHAHAEGLGRTPLAAFGIGLIHGTGGSALVGVLLVGAATSRAQGVLALLLFAGATAASMALVSAGFGYALARGPIASRLARLVPVLGVASLLFGLWYTLGAIRG
jgi:ABC-type nickel/cobalt efflux system permease component RcnA